MVYKVLVTPGRFPGVRVLEGEVIDVPCGRRVFYRVQRQELLDVTEGWCSTRLEAAAKAKVEVVGRLREELAELEKQLVLVK